MSYGKFVAKEPIDFNGVRAFQPGDPVPEDSVKEHGWENLVTEVASDTPEPAPASVASSAKKGTGSRGASSGS